jgi:rhamnulokinase
VQGSPLLDAAESFLMIPDFFHWLLTGVKANEFTNATTTQFYNPALRRWSVELLRTLDLPTHMLGEVVEPGANLGPLRSAVLRETGLAGVDVVAPGTHDTASAVVGVPASGAGGARPDWCYISLGTWALMGVETAAPVVTDDCLRMNFTNEGGVGRTIRLLKNITGLWLVQECRRIWAHQGREFAWPELYRLADEAPPLATLVDPDDPSFLAPDDMPATIQAFCRRTNQTPPTDPGAIARTALDSLALKCRVVLSRLENMIGGRIATMHVVGGGAQLGPLCQAVADACGRTVVAGPVEATASGNVLVQAMAAGELSGISQAREVLRRSNPLTVYSPRNTAAWDAASGRFATLLTR